MFEAKKTDNFSKSIRCGRIAKCSDLCTGTDGRQYIKFSVAVNKDKEKADFFECTAYNAKARYIEHYAPVGTKGIILGTDISNRYTDKKNISHTTIKVIVDNVFLHGTQEAQQILNIMNNLFSCA